MITFSTPKRKYTVTSHGNGWGYEITCNTTGDNIWVQDEDATQVQQDTNDFEDEWALDEYFDLFLGV